MKPKFTTEQVRADITALEPAGFKCAVYYLKAELRRRNASSINKGRPATMDTPRHQQMRRASAAYRERKKDKK